MRDERAGRSAARIASTCAAASTSRLVRTAASTRSRAIQGATRLAEEGSRWADGGRVLVGVLELTLAECGQQLHVTNKLERHARPGRARHEHLIGQGLCRRDVAAEGSKACEHLAERDLEMPVAVRFAELQAFVGERLDLVPLAGFEGVATQDVQAGDQRADGFTVAFLADDAPQRARHSWARSRESATLLILVTRHGSISSAKAATASVSRSMTGAAPPAGMASMLLSRYRSVGISGVRRASAASKGSHSSARPPNRHTMYKVLSASMRASSWASYGPALASIAAMSSRRAVSTSPSPVRRRYAAVAAAWNDPPSCGSASRASSSSCAARAELSGEVGADVGSFDQPSAPVQTFGTEIGGTGQRSHRAHRVTVLQGDVRGLFEEHRHLVVGVNGRFAEVPGLTLGLIPQDVRERSVGQTTFGRRRELDDRGADQWVTERHTVGALVDVDEAFVFSGGEIAEDTISGLHRLEETDVPGPSSAARSRS